MTATFDIHKFKGTVKSARKFTISNILFTRCFASSCILMIVLHPKINVNFRILYENDWMLFLICIRVWSLFFFYPEGKKIDRSQVGKLFSSI